MKFLDCGFGIKFELLPDLTQVFKKISSDPNQEARQGGHGDQTQYFLFPHQIPHRICSLSLSGDHEPNLI